MITALSADNGRFKTYIYWRLMRYSTVAVIKICHLFISIQLS